MTKEEIVSEYLGMVESGAMEHPVSRSNFLAMTHVSQRQIRNHWGTYGLFLDEMERVLNGEEVFTSTTVGGNGEMEVTACGTTITDPEELLRHCNIDQSKWRLKEPYVSKHDVVTSDGVKEAFVVKCRLEANQEFQAQNVAKAFRESLGDYKPKPIEWSEEVNRDGYIYFLPLPDLHLGKLAWAKETGYKNYDTKEAVRVYKQAVSKLMSDVELFQIERVVLTLGNDFFNTDNKEGSTTNGTPQDNDSRWLKSFTDGAKLMVDVISSLVESYQVDVITVPGNHDEQRSTYLSLYLESWFRDNDRVSFDNRNTSRKYYVYGRNLIGFCHGKNEKVNDLPLLMMQEAPKLDGIFHKHFLLGHFHHESIRDYKGIKVEVMPSLAQPDAWHSEVGFVGGIPSTKSYLYHSERGLEASFYYRDI